MKFIDTDTESFIKGLYTGESIYDVADEDPEYIRYLLEEQTADAEDRELLEPLVVN